MNLFGSDWEEIRRHGGAAKDADRRHRLEQLYASGAVPRSTWRAPLVSSLPSWSGARHVALDFETRDPDIFDLGCGARRDGCYVVGASFALDDGTAHYLPMRHAGGGNLDEEQAWAYLRDQVRDFEGEVFCADAMYEVDWGLNYGVDLTSKRVRCVLTQDAVLDERHHGYTLDDVLRRGEFPPKDETFLKTVASALGLDPKGDLWQFPAEAVADYAIGDVRNLIPLGLRQAEAARREGVQRAFDLESDLIPVLVEQRRWGIRVDEEDLESVARWALSVMAERFERFYAETGVRVGREVLNSGEQLQSVCDRLHLGRLPLTPSGKGPSCSEEAFDSVSHPAFRPLIQAKKLDKLINTYVKGVRKHMVRGRVHPTIKSVRGTRENRGGTRDQDDGTRSNRTSGSYPNIQNQPNPLKAESDKFLVEMGTKWRGVYKADVGKFWAMADLAQQEPKWTVHYALRCGPRALGQAAYDAAVVSAERWRKDPAMKLAKLVGEMTGLDYGLAKIWFLARCYGAGGAKLAKQLGLPTKMVWSRRRNEMIEVAGDEAAAIIEQCDKLVPYVPALLEVCKAQVRANGGIRLRELDDRVIHFTWDPSTNDYHRIHKALNMLAQPSAAGQLKRILVALRRAGVPAQTTVHDDVSRSCATLKEAQMVREIAENAVKAEVPWYAKLLCGESFGAACVAKETPHDATD